MSNAREARQMLRAHRYGVLSTLSQKFSGYPFGSIIPYLVDHDGSVLILISTLAEHTKNILNDPRVSLITHDQLDPHIQNQGRVTVVGNVQSEPNRERAGLRYLRYFPEAKIYLEMQDFSFYRINPIAVRFIAGFGKIHWVNMNNYAVTQAWIFAQEEEATLSKINLQYRETLRQVLQQQLAAETEYVEAVGLDCDGMDVRNGEQILRLDFPETTTAPSIEELFLLIKKGS